MATQITATLPTLDFPVEADYPTQEDWAAFSAAAEENFGILGGSWSTQMQLWKTEANNMSVELNNNADIAQSVANYQGDWTSKGYTLGQSVSVSGIYYICKLTHATGQNPTVGGSIYWNLAIGNWDLKADKTEVALKADKTEVALKADKTEVALKVDKNMSAYTTKSTPVDDDLFPLSDSALSFGIKKLSWANLKATLLSYFDTLYSRTTAIFGIGQTWQDVTASRSANVTYTNTSGKPIMVSITVNNGSGSSNLEVNGLEIGRCDTSSDSIKISINAIVSNASTYKFTGVFLAWNELR